MIIGAGKMMDIDKITETLLNFERLFDDLNTGCILGDESYINPNIYDVTVYLGNLKDPIYTWAKSVWVLCCFVFSSSVILIFIV